MERLFIRFATLTAKVAGKPWTFIACLMIVLIWAVTGPIFRFSETWQLVINTGTTIITFLMVFLIQNTQNRDGAAMQAKLDELVYAVKKADARFIGIEHLTERELDKILEEVEHRAQEVHAGKPARAIKGKPAVRAEDVEVAEPRAATPAAERKPATRARPKAST
ncbi:low affinity iron permease family protein [Brevundimonas subvibrioides]|uniref:low affinity iron permease family protein n=1 Tax=Brevundimonas subvibrioides TaxID=74313 RepID=UPI0022B4C376|nr:low affinity iron permease family protein [Brevundimonas subvibrioides]